MLTDGEKMIKTPTYHVFHMYRHHQGATLLRSDLIGAGTVGAGKNELPKVIESVSENAAGVITVTLTNNSLEAAENVTIQADGRRRCIRRMRGECCGRNDECTQHV